MFPSWSWGFPPGVCFPHHQNVYANFSVNTLDWGTGWDLELVLGCSSVAAHCSSGMNQMHWTHFTVHWLCANKVPLPLLIGQLKDWTGNGEERGWMTCSKGPQGESDLWLLQWGHSLCRWGAHWHYTLPVLKGQKWLITFQANSFMNCFAVFKHLKNDGCMTLTGLHSLTWLHLMVCYTQPSGKAPLETVCKGKVFWKKYSVSDWINHLSVTITDWLQPIR